MPDPDSPPPLLPLSSLPSTPANSRSPSPAPIARSTLLLTTECVSAPSGAPISNTRKRKNQRNKLQSKKNKMQKRQKVGGTLTAEENPPPSSSASKHVVDAPEIDSAFSLEADAQVASTTYIGHREGRLYDESGYFLWDLVGPESEFGFQEVEWDGRTATPIIDKNGLVFGLLAGCPDNDSTWEATISAAGKAIGKARSKCKFTQEQRHHRRGDFLALTTGISYGGRQTVHNHSFVQFGE
ncbi:hypothetical protein VKT23_017893 [Stygiomarasmius scandens]|uniref:Uncharacterized protein n=1 Tax=Marasmiellus scandens TaxID=2682957 RepID=A0ABR1IQW3_9AGAR